MKMMKWLVCLLVCALMFTSAVAEAPASQGAVTDLADVLSAETASDMETLSQRLQKVTGGKLYVLTRHFLGGQDVNTYGQEVFEAWKLGKNDALLLLVIGEETYALIQGSEAQKNLSSGDALRTFLSNNLSAAYRARNYDQAVGNCMTAYARKMAGGNFNVSGLFSRAAGSAKNTRTTGQTEEHYMFSSNWNDAEPPREESGLGGALVLPVLIVAAIVLLRRKKKKTVTYARYSGSYRPQEHRRPGPQRNRNRRGPGPFGW